jgi:hypothetical protein
VLLIVNGSKKQQLQIKRICTTNKEFGKAPTSHLKSFIYQPLEEVMNTDKLKRYSVLELDVACGRVAGVRVGDLHIIHASSDPITSLGSIVTFGTLED